jgi:hypothetical protein
MDTQEEGIENNPNFSAEDGRGNTAYCMGQKSDER